MVVTGSAQADCFSHQRHRHNMSQLKILLTRHLSTSLSFHQCYTSFIFLLLSWERRECETREIRNKMTLFRGGGGELLLFEKVILFQDLVAVKSKGFQEV
jgi:hypothetical protein